MGGFAVVWVSVLWCITSYGFFCKKMAVITKNRGFREFLLKKIFFDFLQKCKKPLKNLKILEHRQSKKCEYFLRT